MKEIKNIKSIEELMQYDKLIRHNAYGICYGNSIADDLVNDLYIKLIDYFNKGKVINGGLIFVSLNNAYRNYVKRQNKLDMGTMNNCAFIPDVIDDYDDIYQEKLENENKYNIIDDRLKLLTWYERKVLDFSLENPLTLLALHTGISYKSLYYTLNKIKIKLGMNGK